MDGQNNRFDAYELGRIAGAKLDKQNNALAREFPNALHALFSDVEFREAMVVGGVTSEELTQSTLNVMKHPHATTNCYNTGHPPDSIPPRPGSTTPTEQSSVLRDHERDQLVSAPQHCFITLPQEDQQCQTEYILQIPEGPYVAGTAIEITLETSLKSNDITRESRSNLCSKKVLISPHNSRNISTRRSLTMHKKSIPPSRPKRQQRSKPFPASPLLNSNVKNSNSNADAAEEEIYGNDFDAKDSETTPVTDRGKKVDSGSQLPVEEGHCLLCSTRYSFAELHSDSDSMALKNNVLSREVLWISLGIDEKYSGLPGEIYPFCGICKRSMLRMLELSELTAAYTEEFDRLRNWLCQKMITKFAPLTPTSQSLETQQEAEELKDEIFKDMQSKYKIVKPGRELLDKAKSLLPGIINNMQSYISAPNCNLIVDFEVDMNETEIVNLKNGDVVDGKNKEGLGIETDHVKENTSLVKDHPVNLMVQFEDQDERAKPGMEFLCTICGKKFKCRRNLSYHVAHSCKTRTIKSQPLSCYISSTKKQSTIEKPYLCNHCDKRFLTSIAKRNHEEWIHLVQPRGFKCRSCDKVYSQSSALAAHAKTHKTGETPYQCNQCDKVFSFPQNYKDHLRRHQGIKRLECLLCKLRFDRMRNVTSHFKKFHPTDDLESNLRRYSLRFQ